jgi:6-phosphogluconolactonase
MADLLWAADGSDAGVVAHVAAVVAQPGLVKLCLPGGVTPRPIFATLAAMLLPWNKTTIVPGDEREVPHDHPSSNVGQLRAAFGATGATIQPLSMRLPLPRFDLVWLGMGSDGHVASLFPDTNFDRTAAAAVVVVTPDPLPPEALFARLTLTLAALTNSNEVILVIRGDGKRALLEAAARGDDNLPVARLLALAAVTVFWSEA